jgi:hypothetical protein
MIKVEDVIVARVLYYYPVVLASVGILVHVLGTLGLYQTQMARSLHMIIYAAAIMVLIGLLNKSLWGYILALCVLLEQIIRQGYWIFKTLPQGQIILPLMICTLVSLALAVLIFKPRLFISPRQRGV